MNPQDSLHRTEDARVPRTLDCTVPSPALTTGFCGDKANMWLPFTVTYCCTEVCVLVPVAGSWGCWGSSPGSCFIITF